LELNLELTLPTSINKLYINQVKYNPKVKTFVPTGKRIMSEQGKKVKKQIQSEATKQLKNQEWDYEYTKTNYIYMDTIIYFTRTNSDDNNIYKLLCDSLEKITYENDSRVLVRTQRIYYSASNPRVEVKLSPVEYIGIFDNQDILNEFESKCKTCNRYARNCSILNKAKEGRIQEEIDDTYTCLKYKEIKTKKGK